MTTYKVAKTLSAIDAHYIAGLVDGEGTVTLSRKHRKENRQLAITISSTERCLLEFVLHRTGVGKITNKSVSQSHHLKSYAYAVYNRQALAVLRQICPNLKSYKLQRAKLVLKDYIRLTPRNGKYTKKVRLERDLFEAEFFSITAITQDMA